MKNIFGFKDRHKTKALNYRHELKSFTGKNGSKLSYYVRFLVLILLIQLLMITQGCEGNPTGPNIERVNPAKPNIENSTLTSRSPHLGLWLAKKSELIEHKSAAFDLVMTAWFEPAEATSIRDRHPSTKLLAGLTLNWISSDPGWQTLLVTVANGGNPDGPLQITEDMFLMYDDNGDGILDRRCTFPGWENPTIYAMDPRHTGWQELILGFYDVVASQPQHDGVIIDMLDAYSFCEGALSEGMPIPMDSSAWVSGQEKLLSMLREQTPVGKWIIANAGCGFPAESPFPGYLNGYLLENVLGKQCDLGLDQILTSAQRALESTNAPHIIVYAVDTDDTGEIDWPRFRTGLVASLLMDHSYFAFDYGPRDHGGVTDYWFPQYYNVKLGDPFRSYYAVNGGYRRDFEKGLVVIAVNTPVALSLDSSHVDIATGESGTDFEVPQGDARIYLRYDEP